MKYVIILMAIVGNLSCGKAISQTVSQTYFATVNLYEEGDRIIVELSFYDLYDNSGTEFIETPEQDDRLEEAKKEIAKSNAIYFQSFVKNDSSLFIGRYATDACIMAPFAPQACGRDNAAKFFRAAYDDYGLRNGRFITTAVYGDAVEYVTEEGIWQSYNAKGKLFDNGKYLVLWKKTKKGWKMFRDSFSSNRKCSDHLLNTSIICSSPFFISII